MIDIKLKRCGSQMGFLSLLLLCSLLVFQLVLVGFCLGQAESTKSPPGPDRTARADIEENFGKLPLYFIENQGQLDSTVGYYVKGRDKTLFFTSEGLTLILSGKDEVSSSDETGIRRVSYSSGADQSGVTDSLRRWVVKLDFVGANADVRPVGIEPTEAVFSYFKGPRDQWKTGLKTYASVVYRDLWPGIDLVYTGTVNRLKYRFVVRPCADPEVIRLAYRGATSVVVNDGGQLGVNTPVGGFSDDRPYSYQEVKGERSEVATAYSLQGGATKGASIYGFKVGSYDRSIPLIIDPAVLVYCGYIGGSGYDSGHGIAVDVDGNAYITGTTYSTQATFPVTVGPDLTHNGTSDAFVAKVNASGTALDYCGYIGGSDQDWGHGIAVDVDGNAYITGDTNSTESTFPVTVGPDLIQNGYGDAFIAKVNTSGTALDYCGYIGGNSADIGNSIAVDVDGNAYITGTTRSTESTFPVKVGPDLTHNGSYDAFVAKVNASGTALDYCGYIGGSSGDRGSGIAVDVDGNAYVTGQTESTESTFPVIVGPDLIYNGHDLYYDAFVAKVNTSGTALDYCGYIGGNSVDIGNSIAVDVDGNAYVTGLTRSTESTFPVIVGPDLIYNGHDLYYDAFVAKVNTSGTALVYCGYIGGSSNDYGHGIAVDVDGNAYITGTTYSTQATFPVTVGPDLIYNGGYNDAFVAKVNASGTALVYCGYIGGNDSDYGWGIAVDYAGNAYITGYTGSSESTFPVTVGPDLTHNGGYLDAFVAKVLYYSVNFTADNTCGVAPLTVNFHDESTGTIDTWEWDFGDDSPLSNEQNPTHTYEDHGTYTVSLTVTGPGGSDTETKENLISVDPTPWYVDGDVPTSGNGTSWDEAFKTIPEAISAASDYDEIWVKQGTYYLDSTIEANKPVAMYAGFDGTESQRDQRDWQSNITIVHGQDTVRCFWVTADATIDGFTIAHGHTAWGGGGMYNDSCSPLVANCIFSENEAVWGGGLHNYISSPTITNCIFDRNSANDGGGIHNRESSPTMTNCTFSGNNAALGGGIYNYLTSSPTIINCILWGNTATTGSQIYNYSSSYPTVTYCDIDQDGYAGSNGNIRKDPLFVDPTHADYHLTKWSPCIDKGTSTGAPNTDIDGDKRPQGKGYDIGADEYNESGDELAVDFGTNGLWHYSGSSWTHLAAWNPDVMVEWTGGMAVDFETHGLWNYDGSSWTHLAGWNPGYMEAYGTGLAIDFGGNGLWHYDGTSWINLAAWNPGGMVEWTGGMAVDFDTYGLWNYDGTTWTHLAAWNPEDGIAWNNGLAIDFGGNGLWHYDGTSWTHLAAWNPDGMADWTGGMAVDFDTYGLWNYDGTTWTHLAGWNPEDDMVKWSDGIAVDFGGNGLWSYNGSSWTNLAAWNPEDMEAWANGLAVDFGASYGLWNYNGSSWSNLAGWDSEHIIDVNLY